MNTATKAMNDDFFFTDAGLGPGKLTAAGALRPADIFTLLGDDSDKIYRATGIAQDKVCATIFIQQSTGWKTQEEISLPRDELVALHGALPSPGHEYADGRVERLDVEAGVVLLSNPGGLQGDAETFDLSKQTARIFE